MGKMLNQSDNTEFTKDEMAKIYYQCRRGMLELDVFLMPFCKHHLLELSAEMQRLFVNLLTEADPDLFNWLMGHSQADDKYLELVAKIRTFQLSGGTP